MPIAQARVACQAARFRRHALGIEPGGGFRLQRDVGRGDTIQIMVRRPFETGERGSGEPSRWTHGRELEWVMLRPELVVEVTFDHVSGGRIRHGAKVQRWREDKPPAECGIEQLQA